MRNALILLGAIGLALGFLMFGNAPHPDHVSQATLAMQLGGVFLAVGMAAAGVVETIRGSRLKQWIRP